MQALAERERLAPNHSLPGTGNNHQLTAIRKTLRFSLSIVRHRDAQHFKIVIVAEKTLERLNRSVLRIAVN